MTDRLTRWRYWLLSSDGKRLEPFGPQDKTVWQAGETVARCRHDPTHTPPHPDCTCGLYAMSLIDVRYSVACRRWLHGLVAWNTYVEENGMAFALMFGKQFRREWTQSQPQAVIGEVLLSDAVVRCNQESTGNTTRSWRAASATIKGLYVAESLAHVSDALGERYGAPCAVGYPDHWSQEDWDARNRADGHPVTNCGTFTYPSFEKFGLYPPR